MTNREKFLSEYNHQLALAVVQYPSEYAWEAGELAAVYGRMVAAFDRGSYNKDSRAFRETCKALGIKHTYTAIREFIGAK